jgi:hypothetical protein
MVARSIAAPAACAAALLTAGSALAATPNDGQWTTSGGESSGSFVVKGASIVGLGSGAGKQITAPSNFKCNTSNLVVKAAKIKISGGRFSYDGPAYIDKFRAKTKLGHLVWSGTFTSATSVKGKFRFTTSQTPKVGAGGITFKKKKCDSGTKSWTGKPFAIPSGPVSYG